MRAFFNINCLKNPPTTDVGQEVLFLKDSNMNLVSEVDIIFIYIYVSIHVLILLRTNFLGIFSSSFNLE